MGGVVLNNDMHQKFSILSTSPPTELTFIITPLPKSNYYDHYIINFCDTYNIYVY